MKYNWTNKFYGSGKVVVLDGETYYLDSREQLFYENVGQYDIQFFIEWLETKRTTSTSVTAKSKQFTVSADRCNDLIRRIDSKGGV